tara:strand:+ start:1110 stop:1328 length:219 start_codon:yes stop_codon:yes gene_type:complete
MPRRSINGHSRKRSSVFKKKAIEQLELDRQFKRKRDAKWYNTTNKEEQWDAQEEELGNFASTGVTIPPDEAI